MIIWVFLIFALLYLFLMWKAGKIYPILHLFMFVYFIQYLFSTYLIYNVYDSLRFYMEINQENYFGYTVPAMVALFAGVFIFNKDVDIRKAISRIDPQQAMRLGYILIFISILFEFYPVSGLSSFTRYLKYSGAFCLLFANTRIHIFTIVGLYIYLLFEALSGGIFIDFFVLSTYLFFFIVLKYELSFPIRLSFILVAAPVLILVQSVKREYREATWGDGRKAGTELFTELARKKAEKEKDKSFYESEGTVRTVSRLTQGWHLGLTLKWVPTREPFSSGEELLTDITSSLLPRAIFKNKKLVGSQDKFFKYTGHILHNETSMTIGVLGDFYINFGWVGSMIALFVFGAFLSRFLYYFIARHVIPNPINIIWIPFLFNYLMRANNDFYMVFNCLLKGFVIFYVVMYMERKIWPRKKIVLNYAR